MSALTSSPRRIGRHPPTDGATRRRPTDHRKRRPSVGRRVATATLLVALGISLMLSVPALRPVLRAISEISPLWIAVAVAVELASCVSFVIIFRLFFDRVGAHDAHALAWTAMASGALLPGGGVGGLAIGGWLMHLTGAPTRWTVRRCSGLFFLTSAVNSAAVIVAGLLLAAGAVGPHDFARAALPALLAGAATLIVLAYPGSPAAAAPSRSGSMASSSGSATRSAPLGTQAGGSSQRSATPALTWPCFGSPSPPSERRRRSPRSSSATRSATSPTRYPSRAGSACSMPASPEHYCSTAQHQTTWSRPCSSTTQSRSGSPPSAASSPTPACANA